MALSLDGELGLFLNRGDGSFDEATLAAGLAEHRGVELVLCADFDGDGLSDLYLGSATGEPKLLRNLGRLAFELAPAGIDHLAPELSATALDYDRDGRVDLHVSTQAGEVLYHNLGKARFERVALPLASLATLPGAPRGAAAARPGATAVQPAAGDAQQATGGKRTTLRAQRSLGSTSAASGGAFDFANASSAGSGSPPMMMVGCNLAAFAAAHVVDQATGTSCIAASSVPTMDMLYPMTTNLNVSPAGNVGMGTNAPIRKLHVAGDTLLDGSTEVIGGLSLAGGLGMFLPDWDISGFAGRIEFNETNVATRLAISPGGAVGVGVNTPGARLHVQGDNGGSFFVHDLASQGGNRLLGEWAGDGAGPQVRFTGAGGGFIDIGQDALGGFVVESNDVPALTVTPTGEVGIGTTTPNPGEELTVVEPGDSTGTVVVDSGATTSQYSEIRLSDRGTARWSLNKRPDNNFGIDQPGINTFFEIQSFTGNVGIGISPTNSKLHVFGNSRFSGDIVQPKGNVLYFGEPGENDATLSIQRVDGAVGEGVIRVGLGDYFASRMNITNGSGGTVYSFWSNGSAYKPGGGSWSVLSDRRKKHDINDLDGALERLLALRGKTYLYNDPTELGAAAGVQTGFIAQEVETVFPEWIDEQEDGTKVLTVRGFEALAVESLRELHAENASLRERVESLQDEMVAMRQTLQALTEGR